MTRSLVSIITRHWLSLAGAIVALVALLLIITLIGMEISGFDGGPYLGILTYLMLPAVFALGLLMIPVGAWLKRRADAYALAHHEAPQQGLPVIDLNNAHTRGVVVASVVIGMFSVVILGGATYKGIHVMETVAFCGTVCHTVMEPEHTAFLRSPHSKLTCADCHIGSGADWFVKSKISGSWQLVSVAFNLYPTPIPSPVHNLRPARETCEQCHWPTKHVGDKLSIRTRFADDEANTESKTVLLLKVGGQQGTSSSGIHWHVDRGVKIRYQSDPTRQLIYDVEMTTPDGKTVVYKTEEQPAGPTEWRDMDCVDCHNRPAHIFRNANHEVNTALEIGSIDKTLPFVKREALRLLAVDYPSHEAARAGIAAEVDAFYKANHAEVASTKAAEVAAAGKALGDIYAWNVFPKMKVTWGTYKNNIGHDDDNPGCLRCHNREHRSAEGKRIGAGCKTCHVVLAEEEQDPEILQVLKP